MFAIRRLATLTTHLRSLPTTGPIAGPSSAKVGAAFSTSASPANMGAAKDLVDKAIKENDVLVFSKSYCPYCKRAKSILAEVTSNVKVFELDEMDDGSEIQAYLRDLTGQGTVPNIFIKQQHRGGCSDLQAIPKGELKKLVGA